MRAMNPRRKRGAGISDADGLGTYSYQWSRDNVLVNGATSATYLLGDDDVGTQLTVEASYTDGQGTLESLTSAATAAVGNVNDAPMVSNFGGTVSTTADAPARVLDASVTLSDVDNATLAGATLAIANHQSGDALVFTNQSGISGTFDAPSGTLTLTGTATLAQYETAIGSVTFRTSSILDTPRTVNLSVTDGLSASNTQSVTVNVKKLVLICWSANGKVRAGPTF